MSDRFGIKTGYSIREVPEYFIDAPSGITYQPDVYRAAVGLAQQFGLKQIIDIGSGNGLKLVEVEPDFEFTFVDFGPNLDIIKANLQQANKHRFLDVNLESDFPDLQLEQLQGAVVICSDVIEHMVDPTKLVDGLRRCSQIAPLVIISTPDRDRTHGWYHFGPPPQPAHVREWSHRELRLYLQAQGIQRFLAGYTRSSDLDPARNTSIIISGVKADQLDPAKLEQDYLLEVIAD